MLYIQRRSERHQLQSHVPLQHIAHFVSQDAMPATTPLAQIYSQIKVGSNWHKSIHAKKYIVWFLEQVFHSSQHALQHLVPLGSKALITSLPEYVYRLVSSSKNMLFFWIICLLDSMVVKHVVCMCLVSETSDSNELTLVWRITTRRLIRANVWYLWSMALCFIANQPL